MTIREEILEQTNKGISKDQIRKNLLDAGHDADTIERDLNSILPDERIYNDIPEDTGSVSPMSIIIGIIFLIVAVARFARFSSSGGNFGSLFLFIGVFTAIGMAIYFFTKKD